MQFIVFVAFAFVLSVPETGTPWATLSSPALTWGLIAGQVAVPALLAAWYTRRVTARLEREPAWLAGAQRLLARGSFVLRSVIIGAFAASIYLTDWATRVRQCDGIARIWGLDEFVILLPFFAAVMVCWVVLYPADRGIRQVAVELSLWTAAPARPVWKRGRYLSFMLRQHVLIIAVPMTMTVVANDGVQHFREPIFQWARVPWAHEAVLVGLAGLIFLAAPVMLRYIWHTRALPPGDLRDRLEQLCRRIGLTHRRILIWESDGMVVNAAVMGLFRPVRYILLSDGLLEAMDDEKIEAVFGHEAGHVKHWHIFFYLLFAVLSMLIVGGIMEIGIRAMGRWEVTGASAQTVYEYLHVSSMVLIVLIWAVGFGVVSRRFEWQADLFGARTVTPPADVCDQPCFVHGTAIGPNPEPAERDSALCARAASTFADALQRIAILNGIPPDARSWRHSSIANRIKLLRGYARDPARVVRLERAVWWIKATLLAGPTAGLAIAAWLYWPG